MSFQNTNFTDVDMSNPDDWKLMSDICEIYPHIPDKTITYSIRNRKKNGLSPACAKPGKDIVINTQGYGFWLANIA